MSSFMASTGARTNWEECEDRVRNFVGANTRCFYGFARGILQRQSNVEDRRVERWVEDVEVWRVERWVENVKDWQVERWVEGVEDWGDGWRRGLGRGAWRSGSAKRRRVMMWTNARTFVSLR